MAQTKYDIRITFQIAKAGNGFSEVQKELTKTEAKSKQTTKNMFAQWTELRSKILVVKFAIREVINAFDALYSAARGGAQLTQLTESFDRANESIFKTPTLLNDLSVAARGTVTEAELMSGIMTLTAGTSEQLSSALTSNAAELLTIAKAANRLNPTLGDTSYFYQSLTTGIKRASYRILDNLGIVVRVGEANKRWAESNGRAVESLTAEERQMALLNEVLRVGGRLVQQAGGTSESLTDSYDILKTSVQELGNKLKESVNAGILPVIKGMADAKLATIELRAAIKDLFNTTYSNDWANNVDIQLDILEQRVELWLKNLKFEDKVARALRWGQLPPDLKDDITQELASIFLEVDPNIGSKFLENATSAELVTQPTYDALRAAGEKLGLTFTDSLFSGTKGVGAGIEIAEGAVIPYYNLEQAINALDQAQQHQAVIQNKINNLTNLSLTFNRNDVGLTYARLEALEKLNKENAKGLRILNDSKIKIEDYADAMRAFVIEQAVANDGTRDLGFYFAALGFTVDETGIRLGDFNITWDDLNNNIYNSKLVTQGAEEGIRRLGEQDLRTEQATRNLNRGVVDLTEGLAEGEDAGERYRKKLEDIEEQARQINLANIFGDLSTGDDPIPFFNEELDQLGEHLVWVTDSSVTQQEQVKNLQGEYDNIVDTIHDYNTYAKGATLTDDERNEKLQEQYDQLDLVAGKLDEVGGLQGHYVRVLTEATLNQDYLNESLYGAIVAAGVDYPEALALAGVALGQFGEEQAFAILQNAILQNGIEDIADRYAKGEIKAYQLGDAIRNLTNDVMNMENPVEGVTEKWDNADTAYTNFVDNINNNKPLEDTLQPEFGDPLEGAFNFENYMSGVFGQDWKEGTAVDITARTNSKDIIDLELTPLEEKLFLIVDPEPPWLITMDAETSEAQTKVDKLYDQLVKYDNHHFVNFVDVIYNPVNRPPSGVQGPPDDGGQHGLDIMIPPGYPRDSYLVGVSSGERVIVQTPAQQRSSQTTDNSQQVNFYGNVYGEEHLRQMLEDYNEEKGLLAKTRSKTR